MTSANFTYKVVGTKIDTTGDEAVQGKRRGGWPARTREPGERVPMSFRVTPEFKAKLDRVAKESGRSLAQEIELRLERSLDQERHLVDGLELRFGRQVAGLMLAIGHVIEEATRPTRPGELEWLSNPELFQPVVESINLLLQAIDPAANPAVWEGLREFFSESEMEQGSLFFASTSWLQSPIPRRKGSSIWAL